MKPVFPSVPPEKNISHKPIAQKRIFSGIHKSRRGRNSGIRHQIRVGVFSYLWCFTCFMPLMSLSDDAVVITSTELTASPTEISACSASTGLDADACKIHQDTT